MKTYLKAVLQQNTTHDRMPVFTYVKNKIYSEKHFIFTIFPKELSEKSYPITEHAVLQKLVSHPSQHSRFGQFKSTPQTLSSG